VRLLGDDANTKIASIAAVADVIGCDVKMILEATNHDEESALPPKSPILPAFCIADEEKKDESARDAKPVKRKKQH